MGVAVWVGICVGLIPLSPELVDLATGYPNNATANGRFFGGGIKLPASPKFNGPYVITWDGTGTLLANDVDMD